jgi:hypothetical protein
LAVSAWNGPEGKRKDEEVGVLEDKKTEWSSSLAGGQAIVGYLVD